MVCLILIIVDASFLATQAFDKSIDTDCILCFALIFSPSHSAQDTTVTLST